MKEFNFSTCTEEELWKYVASHLARRGINTVLVGGAVVAIYTKGIYKSGDLDFVLTSFLSKNYQRPWQRLDLKFLKAGIIVIQSVSI